MTDDKQSKGRDQNAAQKLGDREGLVSERATKRTGVKARQSAGPDGPDAGVTGKTFKSPPRKG